MTGAVEKRLQDLGVTLPSPESPVANYRPYLIAGDHLFISGQIARSLKGEFTTGRLGADLSVAQGKEAARLCAVNIVAQAKAALGGLDRVRQVLRLTGFVQATPEFADHPQVVNGASDFMVEAFGEKGRHTRTSVGVASLPANVAVEIDAIFWIASA